MYRKKTIATLLIAIFFVTMIPMVIAPPAGKGKGAFDQWGYNYKARIFVGLLGNADENRPGDSDPDTYLGSSTDKWSFTDNDGIYHDVIFNVKDTKLVMKWSIAWHMAVFGPDNVRGGADAVPWEEVEALYGKIWCTNHDVGSGWIDGTFYPKMIGYSRIVYIDNDPPNPIWGTFAVVHKVVTAPGITLVFHDQLYG